MNYIPHTEADINEMLQVVGVKAVAELYATVPAAIRNKQLPNLGPTSELELLAELAQLTATQPKFKASFLGAGRYDHYIPAVVKHLAGRSEFYTAYTPYQPEISQGTLSVIYEYQSMICALTGMDIANASMYDGASALAEAALVAMNFTKRKEIIVASKLHPNFKQVLHTYTDLHGMHIQDGTKITEATAAVIIAVPDLEGNIIDYTNLIAQAHAHKALAIVFVDPLLLSTIEAPGKYGADLVVGEGQPLGIAQSFGGPGLGFFAATQALLRFMPGRIVGKTTDTRGQEAYVLTMQTREQHIRREKATSNICSNQALCALMATVYMSTMGPQGMKHVVSLCQEHAEYARDKIAAIPGFTVETTGPLFREFVVKCPESVVVLNHRLFEKGIIGGYDLGNNRMLICCTELTTLAQIDALAVALAQSVKVYA